MPNYTEDHIQLAEKAVLEGMSIRQASREWGIPYATLCGRLKGAGTRNKANGIYQRLSPTQEKSLVGWITIQGQLG